MAFSYLRGHKIEFVDGEWIYCDTKEPTSKTFEARCCGQGQVNEAYVQFLDGKCVNGKDSLYLMNILKRHSN